MLFCIPEIAPRVLNTQKGQCVFIRITTWANWLATRFLLGTPAQASPEMRMRFFNVTHCTHPKVSFQYGDQSLAQPW